MSILVEYVDRKHRFLYRDGHNFCIRPRIATFFGLLESYRKVTSESSKDQLYPISAFIWNPSVPVWHFLERRVALMRTSLICVQPTLLTMDLNLCPCMVQSQELVHVNSSRVRGPKTPFCVAFAPTAITFAYELGLRRSLARWKGKEKLHPKLAKTSSTSFRRAFGILPCRCDTFQNDEYH